MKSIFTILMFANLLFASDGATIYKKCAGCHGTTGEEQALHKSKKIAGQNRIKTIKQLVDYKKDLNLYGMGPVMKGQVATLTDEDIVNVATYIEQLSSSANADESSTENLSTKVIGCSIQGNDEKIKECLNKLLTNEQNDKPTSKKTSEEKNVPKKVADKGKWDTLITTSPIDDSQKVILTLNANDTIYSSYKTVRPSLILRCAENKTEAYINWDVFLGSDSIRVLLRYDKEKAKTKRWGLSTDHMATFVRGNIPFIKKLLKHKKLLIQVTPYSASPVTTTFDLQGLNEAIKPLRKACHW